MKARPVTRAMLRELRHFDRYGSPTDPADWHAAGALWFHALDRVIRALERRGFLELSDGTFVVTDAGRAALAAHDQVRADHCSVQALARAGVSWIKRGDY